MENAIQTELSKNGVYLIKLNRPEVLNAMNRDLIMVTDLKFSMP